MPTSPTSQHSCTCTGHGYAEKHTINTRGVLFQGHQENAPGLASATVRYGLALARIEQYRLRDDAVFVPASPTH